MGTPQYTSLTERGEAAVDRLVKANRINRIVMVVLAVVVVGLAYVGVRGKLLVDTVQHAAIVSCQDANAARETNVLLWDKFFTALVTDPNNATTKASLESKIAALDLSPAETQGLDDIIATVYTPLPANVTLIGDLEAYVAAHDKQQNCSKAYGN